MQVDWVTHTPKQKRSQQTLDRLLDAAELLLADQQFAELSIKAITARAGCSVGTFYTRFATKDDLLRSLYGRYMEQSRATLAVWSSPASWEGSSLCEIIGSLVRFIAGDYAERRGLRRAFEGAMSGDAELRAMMVELTGETIAGLEVLLQSRTREHSRVDCGAAAAFVHRLVFGVLDQDLRFDGYPGGHDLDPDQMAAALSATLCAWLGVV